MRLDLSGRRFAKLLVLGRQSGGKNSKWLCLCDCGRQIVVPTPNLRSGNSSSCGCFKSALLKRAFTTHGAASKGARTSEYRIWAAMKDRCSNPKCPTFSYYGGRGLTVCVRWQKSFESFLEDMGPRPKGFTLERRDNSKGYSPANCTWASRRAQANNRRTNRVLSLNGENHTVAEWARLLGKNARNIYVRLSRGYSVEEALA